MDSYFDTLLNRITNEMTGNFEKFLLEQFARHGYSRDDICSLIHLDRVYIEVVGGGRMYVVKDEPLFIITETCNMSDKPEGDHYTIGVTYTCEDLSIPVEEEG